MTKLEMATMGLLALVWMAAFTMLVMAYGWLIAVGVALMGAAVGLAAFNVLLSLGRGR